MKLGTKQRIFTKHIGLLIEYAYNIGYELSFSEAYRPQEMAEIYARRGSGIRNSLHCSRLAVDFNLFKNGEYLTKTEDYEPLGVFWESLSGGEINCVWGGRFGDGNHFSIEHNGVK